MPPIEGHEIKQTEQKKMNCSLVYFTGFFIVIALTIWLSKIATEIKKAEAFTLRQQMDSFANFFSYVVPYDAKMLTPAVAGALGIILPAPALVNPPCGKRKWPGSMA